MSDHYKNGIHAITIIRDITRYYKGADAFLVGNIIKYLKRAHHKDDYVEDLRKAKSYMDMLVESAEYGSLMLDIAVDAINMTQDEGKEVEVIPSLSYEKVLHVDGLYVRLDHSDSGTAATVVDPRDGTWLKTDVDGLLKLLKARKTQDH